VIQNKIFEIYTDNVQVAKG